MCVANAYLIQDGKPELIMKNVETVEATEKNTWNLIGLFGDQKRIKARLTSLLLIENQIYLSIDKE